MSRDTTLQKRRSDRRLMAGSVVKLSRSLYSKASAGVAPRRPEPRSPMPIDPTEINQAARQMRALLDLLFAEIEKVIVGQRLMVERLLVGLLTGGHVLLEGVPGLAKTLAVRTLSRALRLSFSRIQFTPDLLPADVIGTQIYNPRSGEFSIKKGPVFANLVLADEINRAPAKVQS